MPPRGFEPLTLGLEVRCSIQLSYEGDFINLTKLKILSRGGLSRTIVPFAPRYSIANGF
jgi:hypothetical protein